MDDRETGALAKRAGDGAFARPRLTNNHDPVHLTQT
jgi:hypothetical protein